MYFCQALHSSQVARDFFRERSRQARITAEILDYATERLRLALQYAAAREEDKEARSSLRQKAPAITGVKRGRTPQ